MFLEILFILFTHTEKCKRTQNNYIYDKRKRYNI